MARVPGSKNRNGRWTRRVRVPDDVRPTIEKLKISKSFGAVSCLEACRLAPLERTDIDQLFAQARARQRQTSVAEISESELRHLARVYLHRPEASASDVPLDSDEREAFARSNSEDLMSVSQDEVDVSMQRVARDFAKWAKVSVAVGSPAFQKLCHGIRQAEIEHYARQGDRLALQRPRPANPLFADVGAQGSDAVLVRPDRCVFGTGTAAMLGEVWNRLVGASPAA